VPLASVHDNIDSRNLFLQLLTDALFDNFSLVELQFAIFVFAVFVLLRHAH